MKNTIVLGLLNEGRIDELKAMLEDEIYSESLKSKPGAKQRYAAMKRYFKYGTPAGGREACKAPFKVGEYYSFCDGYTAVLTKESAGEIELYNEEEYGPYMDIMRMFKDEGERIMVDFGEVFAQAKSKGYKLTKTAISDKTCVLKIRNSYFNMALVDKVVSILDDGNPMEVFIDTKNPYKAIYLNSSIGKGIVLPIKVTNETDMTGTVFVEAKA